MDTGLAVLQIVVGLLFVGHGAQKLFGVFGGYGLAGTASFMEDSLGLRPGRLHATAAGVAELGAGALLTLGLLVPLSSTLIIAVMATAYLTVHRGKGIWNDNGGSELPLVLVAAVFALTAIGPGELSLDSALGLDLRGTAWALGALSAGLLGGVAAVTVGRLLPRDSTPAGARSA